MAFKKKKILITVCQESISKHILHSFVLETLLADPRIFIVLAVPNTEAGIYEREFGSDRVEVFGHTPALNLFDRILRYLTRHGLRTGTIMADQRTRLLADGNYVLFVLKRALTLLLGESLTFHKFVRWLATFRRAPESLVRIIQEREIDLIIATDVQDNLDIELMRAGRDTKKKLIGLVRSWDNLVSEGGLIQIVPDRLVVWNAYLKNQAVSLHHIPGVKIVIAGIPHYDWYLKKELILPRERFFSKIGLDPSKRTILFTGLGNYFAPHESEVVEIIAEAFSSGELPIDLQMIFRPHPAYDVAGKEKLDSLPRTIFDRSASPHTDDKNSRSANYEEKIAHQLNSIYHADLIVTTPSSMIIDAVPFNKPAVGVAFDGKSHELYWRSVKRFVDHYTHILDLLSYNAFPIAYSRDELIRLINETLKNPAKFEAGRQTIRNEFIWKLDGKSGERYAKEILGIFKETSPIGFSQ